MRKFTVSRKHWLRGMGNDVSVLHDGGNKKDWKGCCLGHVCLQAGLKKEEIKILPSLDAIACHRELLKEFMNKFGVEQGWVFEAYDINDDDTISDADRERKLIKLFADNNVKLSFVD